MFSFSKRIAIVASLVALYSGQFYAFASDSESYLDDEYGEQKQNASTPKFLANAVQGAVVSVEAKHTGEVQTAFFPLLPVRDIKDYLARHLCERSSPYRLAQVCKAWYQFVMGRNVIVNKDQPITVDPFSKSRTVIKEIMNRWRTQKDLHILRNGIFRFQPEGEVVIDAPLAAMYLDDANGEFALPADVAPHLCVTRMRGTFVKPVGNNTEKTLVLLLTLSELKKIAQQIFLDATFLQDVAYADLSENAVCALIRYGGDDITKWGFRYTILKYREMNNLSIWKIYTHKKARGPAGCGGPVHVTCGGAVEQFCHFSF